MGIKSVLTKNLLRGQQLFLGELERRQYFLYPALSQNNLVDVELSLKISPPATCSDSHTALNPSRLEGKYLVPLLGTKIPAIIFLSFNPEPLKRGTERWCLAQNNHLLTLSCARSECKPSEPAIIITLNSLPTL